MAAPVAIRFLGLARLSARLAKRSQATNDLLIDAVNKGSALVSGSAKNIVAVDEGTLRASIHPIPAEQDGNTVTGGAATPLEYGPYVEFGTGVKGNGSYPYEPKDISLSYGDRPGQVAQPFMYPALNENKDNINRIVAQAVVKGGK